MHDNYLHILRCIYCKKRLTVYKKSNSSSILACECQKYPLVEGILYLKKDKRKDKAISYLISGDERKAITSLIDLRKKLLYPFSLLFLLTTFDPLFRKIFKKTFLKLFGFKNIIRYLQLFGFDEGWSWYIINRYRQPTYYLSLLATGLVSSKKSKVVDIGCGVGHLLRPLSEKTDPSNIIGVDISFLNLLFAKYFFTPKGCLLICCDVNDGLPFIDNWADLIIFADSLFNFRKKSFIIKESNRVLILKGLISITHVINTTKYLFPNCYSLTYQSLSRIIKEAGFKNTVIYSEATLWFLLNRGLPILTDNSDSEETLIKSLTYCLFTGKEKLPKYIELKKTYYKKLKKTNITYKLDKELLSDYKLENLFRTYSNFVFLSPHFDDAVFSCGLLFAHLQDRKKKVKIITIFTKVSSCPFTPQAEDFLRKSGYSDADMLFEDRRKEDKKAIEFLGGKLLHLDFVDAAWRRKNRNHVYKNDTSQFAGEIKEEDKVLIGQITKKVHTLKRKRKNTLILAPLGVGGHVDHVIAREVAKRLGDPTLFWEDFPYNTNKYFVKKFFSQDNNFSLFFELDTKDSSKKKKAIKFYKSQIEMHFPKGRIPNLPERYYQLNQSV